MGVIMYILLCGYPPFYSTADSNALDAGMKRKIRGGEYEFHGDEWDAVSEEARSTIQRMLIVNPAERITIEEIITCSWLNQPASPRPIDTSSLTEADNWHQIQVSYIYDFSGILI